MKRFCFLLAAQCIFLICHAQVEPIHDTWIRGAGSSYDEFMVWRNGNCAFNGVIYPCWVRDGKYFEDRDTGIFSIAYRVQDHVLTLGNDSLVAPAQYIQGLRGISGPAGDHDDRLIGTWKNSTDSIVFGTNDSCRFAGENYKYTAGGQLLKLEQGFWNVTTMAYAIHGTTLMLSIDGVPYRYERTTATTLAEVMVTDAEGLVGTWCGYGEETIAEAVFSEDSVATRCFYFLGNGVVEAYYPSLGQQYSGTWKYDGTRIFFHLPGVADESLKVEKMNHPTTGAPLLLLNGKAMVGLYGLVPW